MGIESDFKAGIIACAESVPWFMSEGRVGMPSCFVG